MGQRQVRITTGHMVWLMVILTLGLVPMSATAQEPNQVGLVIQYGDDQMDTRCVSFEGDQISGDELLAQSGLEVLLDPSSGMGVTVCRIEGQGCDYPAEHCFCQCMGGSGCAYWNYFYREPGAGQWTYSALGAVLRRAKPGAVEAWVWGDGQSPPAEDLTFEAICAPPSPTPTPQPEIEAETTTTASATPASATAEPTTATMQPAGAADQSRTPTAVAQVAASTATPEPTQVPAQDPGPGLAGYWPFGLMVLALVAVGVLVWLRQGRL
jgi:hypothetical protein